MNYKLFNYNSKFLTKKTTLCLATPNNCIFRKNDLLDIDFYFKGNSYTVGNLAINKIDIHQFFIDDNYSVLSICCNLPDSKLDYKQLTDFQIAHFINNEPIKVSLSLADPFENRDLEFLQRIDENNFEFFITEENKLILNIRFKSSEILKK